MQIENNNINQQLVDYLAINSDHIRYKLDTYSNFLSKLNNLVIDLISDKYKIKIAQEGDHFIYLIPKNDGVFIYVNIDEIYKILNYTVEEVLSIRSNEVKIRFDSIKLLNNPVHSIIATIYIFTKKKLNKDLLEELKRDLILNFDFNIKITISNTSNYTYSSKEHVLKTDFRIKSTDLNSNILFDINENYTDKEAINYFKNNKESIINKSEMYMNFLANIRTNIKGLLAEKDIKIIDESDQAFILVYTDKDTKFLLSDRIFTNYKKSILNDADYNDLLSINEYNHMRIEICFSSICNMPPYMLSDIDLIKLLKTKLPIDNKYHVSVVHTVESMDIINVNIRILIDMHELNQDTLLSINEKNKWKNSKELANYVLENILNPIETFTKNLCETIIDSSGGMIETTDRHISGISWKGNFMNLRTDALVGMCKGIISDNEDSNTINDLVKSYRNTSLIIQYKFNILKKDTYHLEYFKDVIVPGIIGDISSFYISNISYDDLSIQVNIPIGNFIDSVYIDINEKLTNTDHKKEEIVEYLKILLVTYNNMSELLSDIGDKLIFDSTTFIFKDIRDNNKIHYSLDDIKTYIKKVSLNYNLKIDDLFGLDPEFHNLYSIRLRYIGGKDNLAFIKNHMISKGLEIIIANKDFIVIEVDGSIYDIFFSMNENKNNHIDINENYLHPITRQENYIHNIKLFNEIILPLATHAEQLIKNKGIEFIISQIEVLADKSFTGEYSNYGKFHLFIADIQEYINSGKLDKVNIRAYEDTFYHNKLDLSIINIILTCEENKKSKLSKVKEELLDEGIISSIIDRKSLITLCIRLIDINNDVMISINESRSDIFKQNYSFLIEVVNPFINNILNSSIKLSDIYLEICGDKIPISDILYTKSKIANKHMSDRLLNLSDIVFIITLTTHHKNQGIDNKNILENIRKELSSHGIVSNIYGNETLRYISLHIDLGTLTHDISLSINENKSNDEYLDIVNHNVNLFEQMVYPIFKIIETKLKELDKTAYTNRELLQIGKTFFVLKSQLFSSIERAKHIYGIIKYPFVLSQKKHTLDDIIISMSVNTIHKDNEYELELTNKLCYAINNDYGMLSEVVVDRGEVEIQLDLGSFNTDVFLSINESKSNIEIDYDVFEDNVNILKNEVYPIFDKVKELIDIKSNVTGMIFLIGMDINIINDDNLVPAVSINDLNTSIKQIRSHRLTDVNRLTRILFNKKINCANLILYITIINPKKDEIYKIQNAQKELLDRYGIESEVSNNGNIYLLTLNMANISSYIMFDINEKSNKLVDDIKLMLLQEDIKDIAKPMSVELTEPINNIFKIKLDSKIESPIYDVNIYEYIKSVTNTVELLKEFNKSTRTHSYVYICSI